MSSKWARKLTIDYSLAGYEELRDYAKTVLALEHSNTGGVYGHPSTEVSNVESSQAECFARFIAATMTPGCECEQCNVRKDMIGSVVRLSEKEVEVIVRNLM